MIFHHKRNKDTMVVDIYHIQCDLLFHYFVGATTMMKSPKTNSNNNSNSSTATATATTTTTTPTTTIEPSHF